MPVQAFVSLDTVHNPAAAGVPPASWFTTIEANFRSVIGRVGASISEDTTQDVTQPGPTQILLGNTDWNNGMTVGSNQITVPASYAGKYLISAGLRLDSTTAGANFVLLQVSAAGVTAHQDYPRRSGSTGSTQSIALSFTIDLAVGNVIALYAQTGTPNPTDLDTFVTSSNPYLSAVWLSA
jgi:hypothetical protein